MEAGILELRKAEEQATAEVDRARKERVQRMKLAKAEAEKEIASYRGETDQKFAEWEHQQTAGEGATSVEALNAEADKQIVQMAKDVEANWTKVADMMIETVMKVDMRIPEARKGVKQGL